MATMKIQSKTTYLAIPILIFALVAFLLSVVFFVFSTGGLLVLASAALSKLGVLYLLYLVFSSDSVQKTA